MTVKATILAIFTEFAWRSLYACRRKELEGCLFASQRMSEWVTMMLSDDNLFGIFRRILDYGHIWFVSSAFLLEMIGQYSEKNLFTPTGNALRLISI